LALRKRVTSKKSERLQIPTNLKPLSFDGLETSRRFSKFGMGTRQYPGDHSRVHAQPLFHRIKDLPAMVALSPQTTDLIVRGPTQYPGDESPQGLVKVTPSPL
jgi:hypothetical protein